MSKDQTSQIASAPKVGKTLSDCVSLFDREHIQQVAADRVSTGFPALDLGLNGGLTSGLYVLGAVPGLGKSTLALQIAYHLSGQGIPVLYFALEMNWAWITAKALCRADFMLNRQAGFQAADLLDTRKTRRFSPQTWDRLNRARAQVQQEGENFYLYEQSRHLSHIGHIQSHIQAFRAANGRRYQGKPLMVVVDYLQILAPRDSSLRSSDKQIVDDNVRELCRLRDQEHVIILLISALNRISYHRSITLESFKESGSIEYSADAIMGMQYQGIEEKGFSLESAKAKCPRELEITLLKMRYGRDGLRIPLYFYSESSFFQQPDGAESSPQNRLQQLREQFSSCPVQYHDGFHRKARRVRR